MLLLKEAYIKAHPNVVFESSGDYYIVYTRGTLHHVVGTDFGLYRYEWVPYFSEISWTLSEQTVESLGFSYP